MLVEWGFEFQFKIGQRERKTEETAGRLVVEVQSANASEGGELSMALRVLRVIIRTRANVVA